jgi:hypothetical protein
MKRLLLTSLLVALSVPALAGGNPGVRVYIDFDPPNYVFEYNPVPFEEFDAYVCVDQLTEGMMSVSLRMDDPMIACPGVFESVGWTHLLPSSDPPVDPPWVGNGIFAITDYCLDDDPVVVGAIHLVYLGGSCCLELLDHNICSRWVVDCSNERELDIYCILAHGNIGGASCPDGDCPTVPVERSSWGTIKVLCK